MLSRSARAETRQSRKEDIKRVMHSIDKVRHWEKRWVVIPDTTMKQYKWMPISQLIKTKKVEPKQRRLFTDMDGDNSRASLGMDEDSNMSNMSTASDSMDGMPTVTTLTKPEEKEDPGVKRMTLMSAEGGRYVGETSETGVRQGRGEYMWPNGDRYTGDFGNGVKNGTGTLYFSNGDKRVGVWKDDKLHGPATYYFGRGRIDEEIWEDDNKISEKRRK